MHPSHPAFLVTGTGSSRWLRTQFSCARTVRAIAMIDLPDEAIHVSRPGGWHAVVMICLMVHSVPTRQLVFSSRPVVRTVRYVIPLVGTSGQVGEWFVVRVRQFMRPSPSRRKQNVPEEIFLMF